MYSLKSMAKFWVGLIVLSLPLMGCDFKHQSMYRPSVVERAQMRVKNSLELDEYKVEGLKIGKTAEVVVLYKENVEIKNVISGNLGIATVATVDSQKENSEKLENLPPQLKFPDDLKDKVFFDFSRKLMIFKGVMSQGEKEKLLELSEDKQYKEVIETLFQKSQKGSNVIRITGVSPGQTSITVTSGKGERKEVKVKVVGIMLDRYEVTLKKGEKTEVNKVEVKIKGVVPVNPDIAKAKVDGNCITIEGVSPGDTSITVTGDKCETQEVKVKVVEDKPWPVGKDAVSGTPGGGS